LAKKGLYEIRVFSNYAMAYKKSIEKEGILFPFLGWFVFFRV